MYGVFYEIPPREPKNHIALIAAAMARGFYRVKNFILSQLNWMMSKLRLISTIFLILLLISCNRPIATSTPDLFATLQASTPDGFASPATTDSIATPGFNFPTPNPTTGSSIPAPSAADQAHGSYRFYLPALQSAGDGPDLHHERGRLRDAQVNH